MENAASKFDKAQKIMDDFSEIFPMSWERNFEDGDREKGSKILLEAREYFERAIGHMKEALADWE